MHSIIRDPRNFLVGIIFLAIGLAALLLGRDYGMGSAGRMGPAFFPSVLGGVLCVIAAVILVRSLLQPDEPMEPFAVRQGSLVIGSVLLFALVLKGAGLAPAVVVLVLGSGLASGAFHLGRYLAVAVALAAFCCLVFIKGLGLPLAVFGPWLGG